MGSRCLYACIRGGGFPDHYRLAGQQRLATDVEQAARVGRAFEVGEDHRSAGVVEEGGKQLGGVDVGLVARRYAITKTETLGLRQVDDSIAEPTRLESARDIARTKVGFVGNAAECRPNARL